ncbi:MAG: hypothetical protein BGO51_04655 [Rhodospirillales bacterium 69-11]|nr:methyltransferase domain-containing protein [Rhodospirillales bacterium]OJW23131.1 MAG: hypothetical protein BGO51_04655 [Rhodospirillales bacterium 69-11]
MKSRTPAHFAALYAQAEDPWHYTNSTYERRKYDHTLSVLGRRRFVAALEVGCSIGVLTRRLAGRSDRVLGIDAVSAPLEAARARCADLPSVRFARMQVPRAWPRGRFDLIVLSELLYFLTPRDIDRCAARVMRSLRAPGRVLLVGWRGRSDDPVSGEVAIRRFIAATRGRLRPLRHARRQGYRLDLLAR